MARARSLAAVGVVASALVLSGVAVLDPGSRASAAPSPSVAAAKAPGSVSLAAAAKKKTKEIAQGCGAGYKERREHTIRRTVRGKTLTYGTLRLYHKNTKVDRYCVVLTRAKKFQRSGAWRSDTYLGYGKYSTGQLLPVKVHTMPIKVATRACIHYVGSFRGTPIGAIQTPRYWYCPPIPA